MIRSAEQLRARIADESRPMLGEIFDRADLSGFVAEGLFLGNSTFYKCNLRGVRLSRCIFPTRSSMRWT